MVFGGNRSCKPDGRNERSPLATDLARHVKELASGLEANGTHTATLTSCFTGPDEALVSHDMSFDLRNETPERLVDRAVESVNPDSRLILIGHSWGGWTAMTVAERIARKSPRSEGVIDGLVTIDPISRRNCNYSTWNNCLTAPSDFTDERREFLRESSRHWANFFQRKTIWLHSSRIPEAHVNKELEATHFDIDVQDTLWRHVESLVR